MSSSKEDDETPTPLGIYFTQNWAKARIGGKKVKYTKWVGGMRAHYEEADPALSPQL